MTLADDDRQLLRALREQHGVRLDKVLKLLETVRDYELKDRRTGVYDAL
ncbi:DNA modification system-associated small protein [Halochromatium roseum]|nr:DNA modification system-associated small protein [Halochromatium roseum]